MNKVLIGVVTNKVKDYCWNDFKAQLKRLEAKGHDVLIVENTQPIHRRYDFKTVHYTQPLADYKEIKRLKGNPLAYVTRDCMNILRQYFLNNDYTHLMVLESDVFIQEDSIDRLLSLDCDVANFTYWMNLERFNDLSLCVQSTDTKKTPRMITPEESKELVNTGVKVLNVDTLNGKTLSHTGYGATLIRRKVLEKIAFRTIVLHNKIETTTPFPDSFFHHDVKLSNFSNYLDTDYIPEHRNINNETRQQINKAKGVMSRRQRRALERLNRK